MTVDIADTLIPSIVFYSVIGSNFCYIIIVNIQIERERKDPRRENGERVKNFLGKANERESCVS